MKVTITLKSEDLLQMKSALTIKTHNFEGLQASHKKLMDAHATLKLEKEKVC